MHAIRAAHAFDGRVFLPDGPPWWSTRTASSALSAVSG
jgi:hypothetical protein